MNQLQYKYNLMVNSLKLLCNNYEYIIPLFPDFADIPDEILSDFETAFLHLPELIEHGMVSLCAVVELLRINSGMTAFIELNGLTYDGAFTYTKERKKIRQLAKKCLKLLRENCELPDKEYI